MDQSFTVRIKGITQNEYLASARRLSLRKGLPILAFVVLATLFLVIFGEGVSPTLLLFPILAMGFTVVYYEITNRRDYKKFPSDLEMTYEIDQRGWRLHVLDSTGICAWANTLRMVETRDVFLLYNSKTTSNLLPKRVLTEEQIEQVRTWYKDRFSLPGFDDDKKEEDEA